MALNIVKKITKKLFSGGDKPAPASGKSTKRPGKKNVPKGAEKASRRRIITESAGSSRGKGKYEVVPGSAKKHGEVWSPGGDKAENSVKAEKPESPKQSLDDRRKPAEERPQGDKPSGREQRGDKPSGGERRGDRGRRSASGERDKRDSGGLKGPSKPITPPVDPDWTLEKFDIPVCEGKTRFHDLDLPVDVMHAIADLGFEYCTPIQAESLAHSLKGENVAGQAQTGTGKTAAFLLAVMTRFLRDTAGRPEKPGTPRALIIAPTRELVIQIAKDAELLGKYCDLNCLAVYGGMDYERQQRALSNGTVDLLVATPGRLLDFRRNRIVDLSSVNTLVIDEADRMLDMGFIPDVRRIISALPHRDKRCTTLYSATLSDSVMQLASQWMPDPVVVKVEPGQVAVDTVKQLVYTVRTEDKFTLLYNLVMHYSDKRILVFCNRRIGAQIAADRLERRGIKCALLSGSVPQKRRLRVLEEFREGKIHVVVATDVAGRGIHVDDIGLVVNYELPYEAEDYVHRIGRTGRAGSEGTAVSFACQDESFTIPEIEAFIKDELKCVQPEEELLVRPPKASRPPQHRHHDRPGERHGGPGGRGGSRGGSRGGPRSGPNRRSGERSRSHSRGR